MSHIVINQSAWLVRPDCGQPRVCRAKRKVCESGSSRYHKNGRWRAAVGVYIYISDLVFPNTQNGQVRKLYTLVSKDMIIFYV